ncbi:unknown [Clostridium sp. CAG:306]|nr:unknown [Clostridium sp. CAG:306]
MNFQIDGYSIKLHRSSVLTTKEDDRKRLTMYVNAICELGNKYLQEEILEEHYKQYRKEQICMEI